VQLTILKAVIRSNGSGSHTHVQPFYGPFSGTIQVSWCRRKSSSGFYGARKDCRGRHTEHPAGRHCIRTNQQPTSNIPPFLCQMPFVLQPSQFNLVWDRHQICYLAYPVAWLIAQDMDSETDAHCRDVILPLICDHQVMAFVIRCHPILISSAATAAFLVRCNGYFRLLAHHKNVISHGQPHYRRQ